MENRLQRVKKRSAETRPLQKSRPVTGGPSARVVRVDVGGSGQIDLT